MLALVCLVAVVLNLNSDSGLWRKFTVVLTAGGALAALIAMGAGRGYRETGRRSWLMLLVLALGAEAFLAAVFALYLLATNTSE